MGDLGAIDEDVELDQAAADDLAGSLRSLATLLETQNTDREDIRATARAAWEGRFGDEFDHRVGLSRTDATGFVTVLREAAGGLDELARLAAEEQARREAAREWVAAQDQGRGWGPLGDVVDWGHDQLFGEDAPPPPPPVEPPAIPIGDPGTTTRDEPHAATPRWPTGGTSAAKPDDLDAWITAVQGLDESATTRRGTLVDDHDTFRSTLGWGQFDASSLISAVGTWLGHNAIDRSWVAEIAQEFRDHGSGVVPDDAISIRLENAGLDGPRESVTYDLPLLWGEFPTSGYADDPVNTASGNFIEREVDLDVGGLGRLLGFDRVYNSRSDRDGPFGRGWSSWASCRLAVEPGAARWVGPDGQEVVVPLDPSTPGAFARVVGMPGLVVVDHDGGLALERFDRVRLRFGADGRPLSAEDGPGTRVTFDHDGDGRLVRMAHGSGRTVRLDWHGERIVALHCGDGRSVHYRYDGRGRLVGSDGGPHGPRRYDVDDDGRVLAVTDADGVVEVRNTYDAEGRVLTQLSPLGRRTRYRYGAGHVTTIDDDGAGPVNRYEHDDRGRLVAVTDGEGHTLRRSYDRWGNPAEVIERDGTVTRREWDELARPVRREGADGGWETFVYDDRGRLVCTTTSTGATTRYRYDGDERLPGEVIDAEGAITRLDVRDGLVHAVTDADGVTVRFRYDGQGDLAAVVDAAGNTTTVERDAAGRVTAVTSPLGARHESRYDAAGRPVVERDPSGGERRFTWTAAGRLRAVVDPAGGRRELRHGPDGALREVVDETGAVTRRRLDPLGNITEVATPDGATWRFAYDRLCRLVTTRDPLDGIWSRDHDVNGRVVATTDPAGVRRELDHDPAGRVIRMADAVTSVDLDHTDEDRVRAVRRPDGSTTAVTYDRCGRITSITDPDGGVRRYAYTPAGRLTAVTSPLGHVTRFEHDNRGHRTAVVDPLGHRWACARDADGRVIRIESPTGEVVTFRYDVAGRLVARTSSDGGFTSYAHDANGRVIATTDPCGGTVRFVRDAAGRLVAAVDANGATTRYERDERGLVHTIVDPLGGRTVFDHDALGRLVRRTDPLGRAVEYAYDAGGRLTARILATGEHRRWWHDASGRVRGLGPADDDEPEVTIARDALGRAAEVDEPGFRHELRWDRRGRLAARSRNGLGLSWRYDADGRTVAVVGADGTEIGYGHDATGRLTAITHPATGTVRVERDPAGRPVVRWSDAGRQSWRYDGGVLVGHEATTAHGTVSSTALERDAAGRVAAVTSEGRRTAFRYDAAGQLVEVDGPDGNRTYAYDAAGRLVAETGPDGRAVATYDAAHQLLERRDVTGTARFSYDAAGRRTSREGPGGDVRTFGWDGAGRLRHVGDHDIRVDALGDLAEVDGRPLVWDPVTVVPRLRWADGVTVVGADEPLAEVEPGGEASWLTADWQGSVGPPGGLDPWGAPPGAGAAGAACAVGDSVPFGYRGELTVDGLVWLRHRAYDPATRSFLSTDPLPGVPGTPVAANTYHYAGNDPVDALDPLGLRPLTDADLAGYTGSDGWLDTAAGWGGTALDWAETGGRYVVGGTMVGVGFLGALNPLAPLAYVLPEPLRPLVALGSPIHTSLGLGQAGLAFVNGERDLDDLGRHVVNGPSTTLGQGLAIMGDGDLSYDDDHGIWTSESTADWTSGRGGTTYGSIFVTPTDQQTIEQELLNHQRPHGWDSLLDHEARHADQWAQHGGGIGFPIVYGIEEWTSGGGSCNRYERDADLEDGGYTNPCVR